MSKYSFISSQVNYNYYFFPLCFNLFWPSMTPLTHFFFSFSSLLLSHLSSSPLRTLFSTFLIYLTLFLSSLVIYFFLSWFLPNFHSLSSLFLLCFPLYILTFIYFVLYLFHSFFLPILLPFPPVMQFLSLIHLIPTEFAQPPILK